MTDKVRYGVLSASHIAWYQYIPAVREAANSAIVAIERAGFPARQGEPRGGLDLCRLDEIPGRSDGLYGDRDGGPFRACCEAIDTGSYNPGSLDHQTKFSKLPDDVLLLNGIEMVNAQENNGFPSAGPPSFRCLWPGWSFCL